jgi:peptidoglycan hydrolase-like protein with peptidoglycan-binding domain
MLPIKFHDFQVSKIYSIFEKKGKDKEKSEPTVKYKENMSIREIPGGESAFKSYMGMFSEALSCLDAIHSIAAAADSEAKLVKSYKTDRREIGISAGKNEESVSQSWELLKKTAKELLNVIPEAIKKNDVVLKYKEEKAKLDNEYKGKEDSGDYAEKAIKLKDVYSAQIDQHQILSMTQLMKASNLYFSAIPIFQKGALAEIEFIKSKSVEDDSVSKDFFSRIGDSIESLVLSKKYAAQNVGTYESEIFEDLVKGVSRLLGKSKDQPAGDLDATNLKYVSDNLMSSLISLAKEIDNVIAWKSSVQGRSTKASERAGEQAEQSASEMISFVRDSVKYVQEAQSLLDKNVKGTAHKEIKEKMDEISDKVLAITRRDGILAKWKDQVLGEKREKTASASYLERGREQMFAAKKIIEDLEKTDKIKAKIKKFEPEGIISGAIKAFKGEPDTRPSRVKKKSDYKTFSKDPGENEKEQVKAFQLRMKDLGDLPSGYKEGELDDQTRTAIKKAQKQISRITGKTYDDSDQGSKEFQQDYLFYGDNIDRIKKMLK